MGLIRILSPPGSISIFKPDVLDMTSNTRINPKMSIANLDDSLNYTAKSIDMGKVGAALNKIGSVNISGFQNRISNLDISLPSRPVNSRLGSGSGKLLDKIF